MPAPPALVAALRAHIAEFGTAPDGRIFVTEKGESIPQPTYDRIWKQAREAALSEAQVKSPLAKKVYDLRHAWASTLLNAGVSAAQVAEWAGHTVEVLLRTYAKCIDGADDQARKRIEEAFGEYGQSQRQSLPPSEEESTS